MLLVEILVIFPDLHVGGLSAWDVPGAFPSLQYLWLTTVEGSLPALSGSNGSVGHTPFPHMTLLSLESDSMTGTLPPEWGSPIAFQSLTELHLSISGLSGRLPASWGAAGSFPQLNTLQITRTSISGSLPTSWLQAASFPDLVNLQLPDNHLTGSLPSNLSFAFPQLWQLDVTNNSFTGSLPAILGPGLSVLLLDGNRLTGQLPAAWGTPDMSLSVVSCQNNKLSGSLPANWGSDPGGLAQLQFLLLYNNSLSGSTPVEWSTAGKHVMLCLASSIRQHFHKLLLWKIFSATVLADVLDHNSRDGDFLCNGMSRAKFVSDSSCMDCHCIIGLILHKPVCVCPLCMRHVQAVSGVHRSVWQAAMARPWPQQPHRPYSNQLGI